MDIIIKGSNGEFYNEAALIVSRQVLAKPDSVIGLATGNTTIGLYESMVEIHKKLGIDYTRVRTFNLDEYVGLSKDEPTSCYARICKELFDHININKNNAYVPDGTVRPIEKECEYFSQRLNECGGIDLQVLSIGENGHIAFNEPGTPFDTDIHIADISHSTIDAKAQLFGSKDNVPRKGITMGIKTIMQSKRIMLVANGKKKAHIIYKTLYGPITQDVPSSVLQLHPALTVVLDKEAASEIENAL